MKLFYDPKEQERIPEARESFSGRLLSDAQFDEGMAITGIVEREIRKSGSFKDKLSDYAYAFARTENFDAGRAETVLRDLFKARTGKTMNQMREELVQREEKLTVTQKKVAYDYAVGVGDMIETGTKISFQRAFSHQGQALGGELGITDAGAKRLMREEFKAVENAELYDWGKELEEKFYRPQIEAERQKAGTKDETRREEDAPSRSETRSRARNGDRDQSADDQRNAGHSRSTETGSRGNGEASAGRRRGYQRTGPRP
jgi:hypothetical protein